MNRIYRLIWNPALRTWVAVSEFAKAKGKGKTGRTGLSATTLGVIGALTLLPLSQASAYSDGGGTNNGDDDSVAIGPNATTGATTSLPANTVTTGNTNINQQTLSNVAIGESANATKGGIALGDHADADTSSSQDPGSSIAIGSYASANKSGGATAIGAAATADGQNSVAFGTGAHANRSGDIAIGVSSTSGTATSSQVANDAEGENISLGNWSTAYGGKSLAIGNRAEATAESSTALGFGSQASGVKALSIGSDASASAEQSLSIGSHASASNKSSLAIGTSANATGEQSFAMGYKAQATFSDAIALGSQAKAQAAQALSFGRNSSATKDDAVAIGSNAKAQGASSVAIGTNAISAVDNSVALGSNSLAETAIATESFTINNKTYNFAGTAPMSTVSIGKKDAERTITNVAAGRISSTSTDAINGSQLFAATQSLDALGDIAVKYDTNPNGTPNYNSVTMGGTQYNSTSKTGGTTLTNVARGVNDSDAVNMSQLNETNTVINNIAGDTSSTYIEQNGQGIRYARTNEAGLTASDAFAKGQGSSAVGHGATATGVSSLALGRDAKANGENDVALGAGSSTDAAVATTDTTLRGTTYTFAGTTPASTLSIGSAGNERTLTNLAAGRLNATSTDAVNGSQLYASNQAIDAISGDVSALNDLAVKYDTNPNGTPNYNSVTMGGTQYNSTSKTGGTTITNVARGVNDSDAVNMSQLNETNTVISNIAGDTSSTYIEQNGQGIRYARTNEAGLTASDAFAKGQGSSAVGYGATATGVSSLALGRDAKANGENDVALGAGSSTDAAVATTDTTLRGTTYTFAGTTPASTVSIGSAGNERTLTNLAAGRLNATSTDAVNGSQLYASNQAINAISGDVSALNDLAVKYDTNPNGTPNYNSVTMGGTKYDSTSKTGGTTLTNVARGVNDSDAVNMSQLNETNTVISNIAGDTSNTYTEQNGQGIRYARTNEAGLTASDAFAKGQGSSAVGYGATATGVSSLALGRDAKANGENDVALGAGSSTDAAVATTDTTIRGTTYTFAGTTPASTVSIGSAGNERTLTNLAAGRLNATSTDAVNGSQLYASNQAINAISGDVSALNDLAVKYDTNPNGTPNYNSVTMGGTQYNSTTKTGGTTITNVARGVNDSDAVNMSQLNETNTVISNIAGDTSNTYTEQNGQGIRYARTNEAGLTASDAFAKGQGSSAVGYGATATGVSSLALGRDAKANGENDVALGAGSSTDAAVATTDTTIRGTTYTFAGTTPASTVSIGSAGNERTLTNLAAGRLNATSTDAVNGSQLYASNQAINAISGDVSALNDLAVKYDTNPNGTPNYNSVTMGGTQYNSTTKTGGTTITNVARGVNDSDAVNVQQLNDATSNMYNNGVKYFHANSSKADSVASGINSIAAGPAAQSSGESSIAMGNEASSSGKGSTAIGQKAQSTGENSVAIGAGAVANNKGDVALGSGATTQQATGTSGTTIRGKDYEFAGKAPVGTVSVGSEGNERTISNVAAGRLSETSTDAVNGSQLYATNQAIEAINTNMSGLENSAVKYGTNDDGSVNYNQVKLAGDTYNQSTHTGGTTISNVAAGVNASDAVNKHQLDQVNQSVTNIAEGKDGMFQVKNTSNLPKPKVTGDNAVAGGAGTVASASNSMALGTSAKATHANAVALGANSVTDRENAVSVGYAGGERQVTNVAAGTAKTDAVNVGQLNQSMNNSYSYTNNKFNELKSMIADQEDKLSAGVAGAMAMASLPQPYAAGANMVSMAGGTYNGQSAVALGVSTISDNGKWVAKLSGSTNTQGDLGGSVGVGYQW